jgi:anti-sigma B factor antagonist
LEIKVNDEKGEIKYLTLRGRIDTNTSTELEQKITDLLDTGSQKILINLGEIDFISSAGLRVLLATAKKLNSSSGELRICSLNEVTEEIFEVSGFSSILNVFKTPEEALEGF